MPKRKLSSLSVEEEIPAKRQKISIADNASLRRLLIKQLEDDIKLIRNHKNLHNLQLLRKHQMFYLRKHLGSDYVSFCQIIVQFYWLLKNNKQTRLSTIWKEFCESELCLHLQSQYPNITSFYLHQLKYRLLKLGFQLT